jgi:TRAP-type C4-dicarboxylate transport system substrate-binding protein
MHFIPALMIAGAILLVAFGDLNAQEVNWKMGSAKVPPDIGAMLDDQVLASMKRASGGTLNVERQAVMNEQEMVQQVLRGRLQMGATSAFGIGAAIADAPAISLPYLWASDEERHFVTREYAMPVLKKLFAEKGLVLLTVGETGYNGVFCKQKCTVPLELKGTKARVSPNAVSKAFWDAVGVIGVQLPVGDVWPSLEQNLIAAGDFPFAYYATTPGVQSAPVFVNTNHLHHPWLYFVNKVAWEKLPADTREKILASFPKPEDQSAQYFADLSRKMDETRARGVTIVNPTPQQLAEWRRAIEPILPTLVAGMGPGAQGLFAAIKEGKAAFAKR